MKRLENIYIIIVVFLSIIGYPLFWAVNKIIRLVQVRGPASAGIALIYCWYFGLATVVGLGFAIGGLVRAIWS